MGYESKVVIAEGFGDEINGKGFHSVVAELNLCCMGGESWRDLFNNVFEGDVYIEDGNTPTTEDKYGEKLKWTTIDRVYHWCITHHNDKNGFVYWRQSMLEGLLKEIMLSSGGKANLIVIHYGY